MTAPVAAAIKSVAMPASVMMISMVVMMTSSPTTSMVMVVAPAMEADAAWAEMKVLGERRARQEAHHGGDGNDRQSQLHEYGSIDGHWG